MKKQEVNRCCQKTDPVDSEFDKIVVKAKEVIEKVKGKGDSIHVISVCIDVLSDTFEVADFRELLNEVWDDPEGFVNSLVDEIAAKIEEKEDELINRGYCPKCECDLTFSPIYEKHEIWGHNQVCQVGSVAECEICGWKGE